MIYPVDDNQLVTPQMLQEQCAFGGANPEDFAQQIWGSSNSEYNSQHRIITAQDYNNWYGSFEESPTVGYANNQCVPFSAFENYYQGMLSSVPTINVNSMGNTSGVNITHSGIVNVYLYSPDYKPRIWFAEESAYQLTVWNNKTGSNFIGERNCFLHDGIKLRTLTENRAGIAAYYNVDDSVNAFRYLDYNYNTGYTRLFTSTWYASVPSLTSTSYLSLIVNDSSAIWRDTYYYGQGWQVTSQVFDTHIQTNLGGNDYYYQIHSPIQLSSKTGTTTNIYIYTHSPWQNGSWVG